MPQGSILKSEFVVTNRYAEAIELRKVAGGCSCQEVTVDKSNLEPGESARISAVWKVSGARHRIRESIWITHTLPTNDKIDAGQMRLRLTADVHPEIEVTPEELKFEAGVPKKVTLQFRAGTKPDFEIKNASLPTPILKVTTDLKQQTVEIEYTGAAPIAVGDSETATIVVETNGTHSRC